MEHGKTLNCTLTDKKKVMCLLFKAAQYVCIDNIDEMKVYNGKVATHCYRPREHSHLTTPNTHDLNVVARSHSHQACVGQQQATHFNSSD